MGSNVCVKKAVEVKDGVWLRIGKLIVLVAGNSLAVMAIGVFTELHDTDVMQIKTVVIALLI